MAKKLQAVREKSVQRREKFSRRQNTEGEFDSKQRARRFDQQYCAVGKRRSYKSPFSHCSACLPSTDSQTLTGDTGRAAADTGHHQAAPQRAPPAGLHRRHRPHSCPLCDGVPPGCVFKVPSALRDLEPNCCLRPSSCSSRRKPSQLLRGSPQHGSSAGTSTRGFI